VPAGLRADGWDVVTLGEHYGVPADEQVADVDWIEEAAKRGWLILMKDKRIRHRQAEIDAVIAHKARCFVITRGDLDPPRWSADSSLTRPPSLLLPQNPDRTSTRPKSIAFRGCIRHSEPKCGADPRWTEPPSFRHRHSWLQLDLATALVCYSSMEQEALARSLIPSAGRNRIGILR
jgi:PIN like domain